MVTASPRSWFYCDCSSRRTIFSGFFCYLQAFLCPGLDNSCQVLQTIRDIKTCNHQSAASTNQNMFCLLLLWYFIIIKKNTIMWALHNFVYVSLFFNLTHLKLNHRPNCSCILTVVYAQFRIRAAFFHFKILGPTAQVQQATSSAQCNKQHSSSPTVLSWLWVHCAQMGGESQTRTLIWQSTTVKTKARQNS